MTYKKQKQTQTALEIIIIGLGKILWWLIKLPFGKKGAKGLTAQDRQEILTRRLTIENMVSDDLNSLKQAVFEADKLVDYILQTSGFAGLTFADRLRSAEDKINPAVYNRIWQGHKVRNQLAHEHNIQISSAELKQAVNNLLEYTKYV